MPKAFFRQSIFLVYDRLWRVAHPFLGLNARLSTGLKQRVLEVELPSADIWIQAASAGESHLALLLARKLQRRIPVSILMTTTTQQGMDTLRRGLEETELDDSRAFAAYFPFDAPMLMRRAVQMARPKVVVLVESEIWPGLLSSLDRRSCPVLVVNGRMTQKSLRRYLLWPSLWRTVAPDKILAISPEDAGRFGRLFGFPRVDVMSNMKFDRITFHSRDLETRPTAADIVDPGASFVVLGSVRKEEESVIAKMIANIIQGRKDVVLGVFPRHMHRVEHWQKRLSDLGVSWRLRSDCTGSVVRPTTVILWDAFGELPAAYSRANAAFVGGSLAPLGGQNFLEPLTCGVRPVIGPSWENFHWIGTAAVKEGLVKVAEDWRAVSKSLVRDLECPLSRKTVQKAVARYVKVRQGGTVEACREIERLWIQQ
jgi:3-deoxy-D-manno-octulosonic-acid transferase